MKVNAESVVRFLLVGISLVAVATGLNIVFQGMPGIPDPDIISQASVDNELRFMAVFWVAFGVYCFTISKSVYENRKNIRYIALVFLCGGVARLLSYLIVGEPIPLFIGAMLLEFALPIVIFVLLKVIGNTEQQVKQV